MSRPPIAAKFSLSSGQANGDANLQQQINEVRTLAQVNQLNIANKADQVDLNQTNEKVEVNRLALLTKADITALSTLALLVDTKADQSYVQQQIALLVGSAPEALNTIYELADAIQSNSGIIDSLNQSVANRVRFDIATQALTELQKQNARTNIGAEAVGTAASLVSNITAATIGAATAAQGNRADTAIQSGDLAPVALSGSFSDLVNTHNIFNIAYASYAIGQNAVITASDTLVQMLGKLQAQISAIQDPITWTNLTAISNITLGFPDNSNPLKIGRDSNGNVYLRGAFRNTGATSLNGLIDLITIPATIRTRLVQSTGLNVCPSCGFYYSNIAMGTAASNARFMMIKSPAASGPQYLGLQDSLPPGACVVVPLQSIGISE